jgi:effector-binding domain-containing protein
MKPIPILVLFLLLTGTTTTMAYEQMFPKTEPAVIELKQLPAMKALKNQGSGSYFKQDDDLFMPLFRYIQKNELAMTTPVESELAPGTMKFFVGSEVDVSAIASTEQIKIVEIPPRLVVAIGIRGSYNEKNYEKALSKAQAWLADQPEYAPDGAPRMIYWNGPFIPWFLKKSELHLPIKKMKP